MGSASGYRLEKSNSLVFPKFLGYFAKQSCEDGFPHIGVGAEDLIYPL